MSNGSAVDTESIVALVEPLARSAGLELYDVERHGNRLVVLVDTADGVGVDQLSNLSRSLSSALDEADPISGAYTLEVSSPGVERRLKRPEHYAGAIGEVVTVRTRPGDDGRRRYEGELVAADESTFTMNDRDVGTVVMAYADVDKARTKFEWGPTARPNAPKQRGRTS